MIWMVNGAYDLYYSWPMKCILIYTCIEGMNFWRYSKLSQANLLLYKLACSLLFNSLRNSSIAVIIYCAIICWYFAWNYKYLLIILLSFKGHLFQICWFASKSDRPDFSFINFSYFYYLLWAIFSISLEIVWNLVSVRHQTESV